MKVAYLFVGHSRTWSFCYQNFFDHIYRFMPGDIYIHTWNKVNTHLGSWWNGWNDLEGNNLAISTQTPDFNGIYNAYKPKYFAIEEESPIIEMSINSSVEIQKSKANWAVRNVLKAFKNVFQIAKNSEKYDKFFCTRMDIKYLTNISIDDFNSPYLLSPPMPHEGRNECRDVWLIGDENQIDIKTKYVDHIDEYWYNKTVYNTYDHETALTDYLNDNNVQYKNINIEYEVIRLF